MPFKAGISGNPTGRPKGKRALTELLKEAAQDFTHIGGELMTNESALARLVWQLATTGEVELGGRRLTVKSTGEWLHLAQFIYKHVDGPAVRESVHSEVRIELVHHE